MSDVRHPIPPNATALSAEWLTESLRRSGTLTRAKVAKMSLTPVDKTGATGATATVVRVALEYDRDDAGAPTTLVAKFASPYDPIRTVLHMFGLYRNEVQFYRQLGADPGIPVPRCYYADLDPASGHFVLLLEDLTDARVGDPLNLSRSDVELAIQHLAPFHARWWTSDRLRELSFIRQPGSPELAAYVAQAARNARACAGRDPPEIWCAVSRDPGCRDGQHPGPLGAVRGVAEQAAHARPP